MEFDKLQKAKACMRTPSTNNIITLERILVEDGFREKILPDELSFSNWYRQHVMRAEEDKTDYLKPYEHGFMRRNVTTGAYAAYGVVHEIKSSQAGKIQKPHHFFFIDLPDKHMQDRELVEYFADKAKLSPNNPAKPEYLKGSVDNPSPDGSLFAFASILLAGLSAKEMLFNNFELFSEINKTGDYDLFILGGLAISAHYISESRLVRRLLKRAGMEDYNAPAGSSRINPEYGIKGLERYSRMVP